MVGSADMSMQTPAAILIDLNDTILDSRDLRSAVQRTCADLVLAGYHPDADALRAANAEVWARLWPVSEPDWAVGRLTGAALREAAWRATLRKCGCEDERALATALERHTEHSRDAIHLYADVIDALDRLGDKCALGIVSNGASDDQRERLAWFDLERHFQAVVISGEVGVVKPDPAIFRLALDGLGLPADRVWHVGDSLRSDVAGAQAAGITAVWLNRTGADRPTGSPQPDIEVASLTELAQMICG